MENEISNSESAYTVVARRYRPRTFEQLIGQDHIAQALGKAISAGRVGHAYLFTGARGVGKTSTARIFAKALNIPEGTDSELAEDIARAIDAGDDMDVIEIDGASNRGIEEIRQLRANVNVRPSRSPCKIYIIDEVHMLTNQAFNALLKTLEEPPGHVKFIFCTTDPDKIPITVLSRCQRFDFAPVNFESIQGRLKEICQCEGFEADDEALGLLARRAAGSMRDSQSLLEQVMSFSTGKISVEQVHALLGTADEGRLQALVAAMKSSDALQGIGLIDESTRGGADAGQLAEQLLGYLRDLLTAGVGGSPDLLRLANPAGHAQLVETAQQWGTQTILSAIQILDEALVRMRTSVAAVTLLEVALVQICQLERLASIPELLDRVMQVSGGATEKKKAEMSSGAAQPARGPAMGRSAIVAEAKLAAPAMLSPAEKNSTELERRAHDVASHRDASEPASDSKQLPNERPSATSGSPGSASVESSANVPPSAAASNSGGSNSGESESTDSSPANTAASSTALAQWNRAVAGIDGMLRDFAAMAQAVETVGSDQWKIVFPPGARKPREYCDQSERKSTLQKTLQSSLGREIRLEFAVLPGEAPRRVAAVAQSSLRAQRMRELAEHPYVKKLCEVIDGEILRVDPPRPVAVAKMNTNAANSDAVNSSAANSSMSNSGTPS